MGEDDFSSRQLCRTAQGGTIALEREAYFEIGGYDECFVGWGGEDNEFFQRCQTTKVLSIYVSSLCPPLPCPAAGKVDPARTHDRRTS